MCPATQHQLSVKLFHILIDLISIGLNGTLEVMQQHHGRFLWSGTPVVMEEKFSGNRTAHSPYIALDSSFLFIVHHRKRTLIYLDVITRENPSSKMVIEWFEQFTALGEPVSHCRRADMHSKICKSGNLSVKRYMVKVLLDDNLCQKGCVCHAFMQGCRGKWGYKHGGRLIFSINPVWLVFKNVFSADRFLDVELSRFESQTAGLLRTYANIFLVVNTFRINDGLFYTKTFQGDIFTRGTWLVNGDGSGNQLLFLLCRFFQRCLLPVTQWLSKDIKLTHMRICGYEPFTLLAKNDFAKTVNLQVLL